MGNYSLVSRCRTTSFLYLSPALSDAGNRLDMALWQQFDSREKHEPADNIPNGLSVYPTHEASWATTDTLDYNLVHSVVVGHM